MPIYKYVAVTQTGITVKGKIQAEDLSHARKLIKQQQLHPVSVSEVKQVSVDILHLKRNKLTLQEKLTYFKTLYEYIRAGITIIEALRYITNNFPPGVRHIIERQIEFLRGGRRFFEVLDNLNFDDVERALLRAGDESGKLEEILLKLYQKNEKAYKLRRKLISASVYPVAVLIMLCVAVGIIIKKVYPQIRESITSLKPINELPLSTQRSFAVMDFIEHNYLIIFGVLGLLVGIIIVLMRVERFKRFFGKVFLHLPLIKGIIIMKEYVSFATVMALCLDAGIDILMALKLGVNSVKNVIIKERLYKVYFMVSEGGMLADSLGAMFFDGYLVNLVRMGETTGRLPESFASAIEYYDEKLNAVIDRAVSVMPILIIVIVGSFVGYMFTTMLMPIFDLSQSIR